jgi:hypothetical protein
MIGRRDIINLCRQVTDFMVVAVAVVSSDVVMPRNPPITPAVSQTHAVALLCARSLPTAPSTL